MMVLHLLALIMVTFKLNLELDGFGILADDIKQIMEDLAMNEWTDLYRSTRGGPPKVYHGHPQRVPYGAELCFRGDYPTTQEEELMALDLALALDNKIKALNVR